MKLHSLRRFNTFCLFFFVLNKHNIFMNPFYVNIYISHNESGFCNSAAALQYVAASSCHSACAPLQGLPRWPRVLSVAINETRVPMDPRPWATSRASHKNIVMVSGTNSSAAPWGSPLVAGERHHCSIRMTARTTKKRRTAQRCHAALAADDGCVQRVSRTHYDHGRRDTLSPVWYAVRDADKNIWIL